MLSSLHESTRDISTMEREYKSNASLNNSEKKIIDQITQITQLSLIQEPLSNTISAK